MTHTCNLSVHKTRRLMVRNSRLWFPVCFWAMLLLLPGLVQAQSWRKPLPGIGTFSSPRVADLNGDGTADVILGAGREEFQACDSAVMAFDGKSGELLWQVSARDQIFGSAAIRDLTGDGTADVVINGRSAELKAIDGTNGHVLWEFLPAKTPKAATSRGWYNFYNPQFVPDQDGDGLDDLLVANGGDVMAEPYDPNRPAGKLVVVSARTGQLLAAAPMPDGKEIYMSVAAVFSPVHQDVRIIFGTGGETIGGHLYVGSLAQVMAGDLSGAQQLAVSTGKGFIAPPAWVDLTADGEYDIVALAVDGRVLAFDGIDGTPLWERTLPDTEIYSSLAIGNFTGDSIPDFFVSVAQGDWPKLEWNRQFMLDGQDGRIAYTDSLGFYQTSTAVVADFSGNGLDEVLLSVNFQEVNELYQKFFYNMLVVITFDTHEVVQIGQHFTGSNISSTPWIGDLDHNGFLDIIYCHSTNKRHTYTFDGMQVMRLATDIPLYRPLRWGAYMGSKYDGVYR